MANYINGEILSEAYSHLNVDVINDEVALEKLKNELTSFFEERAKFMFGDAVKIEIEFEEGSLITKIKVVGSAALAIGVALNTYGSFRQSIDYLASDATTLAQSANLEMVFRTRAAYCDRVRVEKRRGVFGRVDELLNELDLIKRDISESKLPTTERSLSGFSRHVDRLNDWNIKANTLFDKFDSEATTACVAAGLLEELDKFPTAAPWESELKGQDFRTEVIRSNPAFAGKVSGRAQEFKETVRYIQKYYKDIVQQYAPKRV